MSMYFLNTLAAGVLSFACAQATAAEPFAVVELFTSEGCSSCPAADKLASELVKEAEEDDKNVYVLSFHVDYWDRLGWKDPYSSEEATERQSAYAIAWRARSAYTPQMVINGVSGFVGSDRDRAERDIDAALDAKSLVAVNATVKADGDDELDVNVALEIEGEPLHKDWDVIAALVERDLSQKVKRGENKGRTLHHDNVVRDFEAEEVEDDHASIELDIEDDVERANASVIVFVQDRRSLRILGATRVELPQAE